MRRQTKIYIDRASEREEERDLYIDLQPRGADVQQGAASISPRQPAPSPLHQSKGNRKPAKKSDYYSKKSRQRE